MKVQKRNGFEYVDVETANGVIRVWKNAWGDDYPGVAIDFIPEGAGEADAVQIATVENTPQDNLNMKPDTVTIHVWEKPAKEDFTYTHHIAVDDIRKAHEEGETA